MAHSVVSPDGYPVIVELGSGTDMLARCLHGVFGSITLLDAFSAMVEIASKASVSEGLGGWSVTVADLPEGTPSGPYELVLAQTSLHHVDNMPALLRALRWAVTPSGVMVITDLDHDAAKRYHVTTVDFHGHCGFCRDELCGWLEQAGYHNIRLHDAGVVGKEVGGRRQDFPVFLVVARV